MILQIPKKYQSNKLYQFVDKDIFESKDAKKSGKTGELVKISGLRIYPSSLLLYKIDAIAAIFCNKFCHEFRTTGLPFYKKYHPCHK